MNIIEITGFLAAILTTSSFAPQAIKVVRTKQTRDISLGMFSAMTSGILLWLVYGLFIVSWPIIIANAISFVLSVIILGYKIKYK